MSRGVEGGKLLPLPVRPGASHNQQMEFLPSPSPWQNDWDFDRFRSVCWNHRSRCTIGSERYKAPRTDLEIGTCGIGAHP